MFKRVIMHARLMCRGLVSQKTTIGTLETVSLGPRHASNQMSTLRVYLHITCH